MFIGHYAVGFGSRKADLKISLGTFFMAAVFLDLIWPFFLLTGIEHVKIELGNTPMTPLNFYDYPYSHSLVMSIVWSALFGGIYYLVKKNKKGAFLLGLVVFSHWVLDFISHRPDLQIAPGIYTYLGLGLWYSIPATLIVETLLFAAGIYLYLGATRARDKTGSIALWAFIIIAYIIYVSNAFSPPPPSVKALEYTALGQWLFIAWGYWIDRHRSAA